jgi:hypothetical protein
VSLRGFAADLRRTLEQEPIPADVSSEGDMECRVVVPVARRLAALHNDVLVYAHPFGESARCSPRCAHEAPPCSGRILGCRRCWAASKAWATTRAFGTRHTFDLVARARGETLAVELKLARVRGGRMPNGDLQRFLGQCALAGAKHSAVVGLFACQGTLALHWNDDTKAAIDWFERGKVKLVFRSV